MLDYIEDKDIAGNTASGILGTIKNSVVATGADVVSTLWNSTVGLVGLADDIKTQDILSRVDKNALHFFNEHRDGVEMASFFGGLIAPQIVAIKLLGAAKQGKTLLGFTEKAYGRFGPKRGEALQGELKDMLTRGAADSDLYRTTLRRLYVNKIGENVIDALIFETIAVGTVNAHPMMEDYMADPVSNFALWAGLGAGLGGTLGILGSQKNIRKALSDIATEGTDTAYKSINYIPTSGSNADKFQAHTISINNQRAILQGSDNQFTKDIVEATLLQHRARREEILFDAAPWLKPTEKNGKTVDSPFIALKPVIEEILSDPKKIGVNKIRLPRLDFVPGKKKVGTSIVEFDLTDLIDADGKTSTVFFRPSTGEMFDTALAARSAHAVDLANFKLIKQNYDLASPGSDFLLNNLARSDPSARIDGLFLQELHSWGKIKPEQLPYIGIAPDNLARLNAAASWLARQDSSVIDKYYFNVTSDLPTFNQTKQFFESGAAGVKTTHLADIQKTIEGGKIAWIDVGLTDETSEMVSAWIHGGVVRGKQYPIREAIGALRRGMDYHLRGTLYVRGEERWAVGAEELWNKGQAARDALRQHADKDGFIYLYRGTGGREVKGAAAIESFTTSPDVGRGFNLGQMPKPARVHIDNIIGVLGRGNRGEFEILVAAPHHPRVKDIPIFDAPLTPASQSVNIPSAGSTSKLNGTELVQHYRTETERQIKSMVSEGSFSFEEIAARTNTTPQVATLVSVGRTLDEIPNWQRYVDPNLIEKEYLNTKNRFLALQGNPHAVNAIDIANSLDQRNLNTLHQHFVETMTAASHSDLANRMLEIYSPLNNPAVRKEMGMFTQMLKDGLGEVNNVVVKSPFAQSLDNTLRNLQTGPVVTYLGKLISDTGDAAVKHYLEPISLAHKAFTKTEVAEGGLLNEKLLSLSGWRMIRVDPKTGLGHIVQREIVYNPETKKNQLMEIPVKNKDGSDFLIKQPKVIEAFLSRQEVNVEILKLHNLMRSLKGQPPLDDLGFYTPPPNLVNKYIAYVIDNSGNEKVKLLLGETEEELRSLIHSYKTEVVRNNPLIDIITKKEQEQYNLIHAYYDGADYITIANNQMKHGGSIARAIPPGDTRWIDEIVGGYQQLIVSGMRKYQEMYLNDVMQKLDMMSNVYQKVSKNQPLTGLLKRKSDDAAMTVKNALLGVSNVNQFTTWKTTNEYVDMAIVRAGRIIDATANTFGNKAGTREYFDSLNADLKKLGIDPGVTFSSFDLYETSILGAPTVNSKRAVAAANGLAGTMMLRFMELGHATINAISLPILASGALMEGLPKTVLPNGERITLPLRLMYDALRFGFNPKGREMVQQWEKMGLLDQVVRQFEDVTGKSRVPTASRGVANAALDQVESFLRSDAVSILSKPSDFIEKWTRKISMQTGYLAAKHAYPGIGDRGATIYAVTFADRIIGNYHAAQRPVLFQGSFGAMLGLFQTYMTTFAQHTYRAIEQERFAALASSYLMQAGIFGTSSWPGYDSLSKFIGTHMSSQNYDLTTGTYRAIGDPMAEVVLYGLPSMLGPNLYTRGDINPRIPAALTDFVIPSAAMSVYNSAGHMFGSLANQPTLAGKAQGFLEGLSLQSLSRPLARMSEVAAGESITAKGHTVAASDEVWSFIGIASRLLSVRPREEQIVRDVNHLNSYYSSADHANRQNAVRKMRIALRAGELTDDLIEDVASEYLRSGGSAKGWNNVMNEIMVRTEEGTRYDLLRKLEPDSPLRRMIGDTF